MRVVIVKYNAGNIQSVDFALQRVGVNPIISDDLELIKSADKVIFPGVGEASTAMSYLNAKGLSSLIKELKQPVLGICLGMQLMCDFSEEGNTKCLGIFNQQVKKFVTENKDEKIPQVGWNTITALKSPLLNSIRQNEFMYFVHSYYVPDCSDSIAKTNYIIDYSSALNRDNFYGVQFHPEKSSKAGEVILKNFLKL